VTVPASDEDLATGILWEQGTIGIEVRPEAAPGNPERPPAVEVNAGAAPARAEDGEVVLLAYFREASDLEPALAAALAPLSRARLEPAAVPDVDWVARFRDGFRTFRAAGFVVTPPWEIGGPAPAARDLLIVDPGRAFGTGTHESTRLCLSLLRELAERAPLGRVLDLGTGSGILGVAAARLGARTVTAVDLDPQAIASAGDHARLNGVELRLVRADLAAALRPGAFDLIVANLAAPLLVSRRHEILALAAPSVVLSGLLTTDAVAVRAAYEGEGRLEIRRDGEWTAILVDKEPARSRLSRQ
jgi:ribosomal protein L11 methyltransferase